MVVLPNPKTVREPYIARSADATRSVTPPVATAPHAAATTGHTTATAPHTAATAGHHDSAQVPAGGADQPAVVAEVAGPPCGDDELTAAVHAAQHGDEEAFRAVYRSVQPGLLRYLRGLVGSDAEDVASDAWLQIARDLGSFSGDGDGFRGWAATIARHRALDHQRRLKRRPAPTASSEVLTDLAADQDTAGEAIQALSTDAAIALISVLPRDQAEAVLLRVVMGLDAQTAGRVLGKRAGAVRTAAYRGLRRLAGYFDDQPGGTSGHRGVTDTGGAALRIPK